MLPMVRTTKDWHPDADIDEDEWLRRWEAAGWAPEWPPPYVGRWCSVGGVERKRWCFVLIGSFADKGVRQDVAPD